MLTTPMVTGGTINMHVFSSRRRHTRSKRDWSSDVCSSDLSTTPVPVVVDAGIGVPSHAAQALEMGAYAVLVNTEIAVADDPVNMAKAFRLAVEAGLLARQSGPGSRSHFAHATSPMTGFLEASA